jgi:hypothetical protein
LDGCTVRVSTLNSAVLGLGPSGCGCCTVCVFRQEFALEDAIEFHAFAPLEALACVRPMACLSGVATPFTGWHHKSCRNTEGTGVCQPTTSIRLFSSACGQWYGARFFNRILHSRMPLDPTCVRLKRCHACDPMAFLSGVYCLLPVGTVNSVQTLKVFNHTGCNPNPNPNPNHHFCPNTEGVAPNRPIFWQDAFERCGARFSPWILLC